MKTNEQIIIELEAKVAEAQSKIEELKKIIKRK